MASVSNEIAEQLLRVLNKYVENQKKPRRYGLRRLLFPAEVHTIVLIGRYPEAGVTELAERAGVTKGAISQMLQQLEDKKLIRKSKHPESGSRVLLELTNKGKIAYYSHEQMHEDLDRELFDFLDGLTASKLKLLGSFLSHLESGIDKRSET
ncbi:MAG: MarR family transcriptional regulator [candidate division Zixibacteria bacterium]|nr:MarR family transcriptional regulator [candidate division Zixibacteria bacterium]MDH3938100.1 MarR family transcriptional regulator [candidate division Zixibacteria bacterium]MDH4032967.1 MarR family transcriptional regulator [candidate division Zixibacteria bacterium]